MISKHSPTLKEVFYADSSNVGGVAIEMDRELDGIVGASVDNDQVINGRAFWLQKWLRGVEGADAQN